MQLFFIYFNRTGFTSGSPAEMNSVDKDRRSILPKNKHNLLSELNVSAVIEDKQDSLTILQRNITENGNENNLVWISFLPLGTIGRSIW